MSIGKLAKLKVIPETPLTGTIVSFKCFNYVPEFKLGGTIWKRIEARNVHMQQLKTYGQLQYRCSPLDVYSIIKATAIYRHKEDKGKPQCDDYFFRVKISPQLEKLKQKFMGTCFCRIFFNETYIKAEILVLKQKIYIFARLYLDSYTFSICVNKIILQDWHDVQQGLRLYFKQQFAEFLAFYSTIEGNRPPINEGYFLIKFNLEKERNIVLLDIAKCRYQCSTISPNFTNTQSKNDLVKLKFIIWQAQIKKERSQINRQKNLSLPFLYTNCQRKQRRRFLSAYDIKPQYQNQKKRKNSNLQNCSNDSKSQMRVKQSHMQKDNNKNFNQQSLNVKRSLWKYQINRSNIFEEMEQLKSQNETLRRHDEQLTMQNHNFKQQLQELNVRLQRVEQLLSINSKSNEL